MHPSFQENHSFFEYSYHHLFWMFVDQYAILFLHEEFFETNITVYKRSRIMYPVTCTKFSRSKNISKKNSITGIHFINL